MIIDELIALLGFKVEGMEKVKAATRAMNPLQKNLKTTASRTALAAGAAGKFKGALAAMGAAILAAGRGLRALLAGLLRFIGIGAAVGGGLGLIAAGALALAKNFAKARGEAAQLRKEANALAGQQRTTTGTQNAFDGAIQLQGFSADFAKKVREGLFEKLSEAADEAIRGEGEGKEKLKKLGIGSAMDAEGNQRDTGALALQALGSILQRARKNEKARQEIASMPTGKKRTQALKQVNADELSLRKDLKEFDLGKEAEALVQQFAKSAVSVEAFTAALEKAASLNPGENKEQSERTKQIAEAWGRISVASEGLSEAFGRLRDFIVNGFIGPLASVIESIVDLGKRMGLINKTRGEVEAEQEMQRETNRARSRVGTDSAARQEALRLAEGIRKREELLAPLRERAKAGSQPAKSALIGEETKLNADKARFGELLEQMKALGQSIDGMKDLVSPQQNIDAMMRDKKTEAGKTEDNRQYSDIGNDQRTITNSVTVNATGLEGVVNAVKNALNSSNLIKATTASTGAITQS